MFWIRSHTTLHCQDGAVLRVELNENGLPRLAMFDARGNVSYVVYTKLTLEQAVEALDQIQQRLVDNRHTVMVAE